jgi:hypothetical protein
MPQVIRTGRRRQPGNAWVARRAQADRGARGQTLASKGQFNAWRQRFFNRPLARVQALRDR